MPKTSLIRLSFTMSFALLSALKHIFGKLAIRVIKIVTHVISTSLKVFSSPIRILVIIAEKNQPTVQNKKLFKEIYHNAVLSNRTLFFLSGYLWKNLNTEELIPRTQKGTVTVLTIPSIANTP